MRHEILNHILSPTIPAARPIEIEREVHGPRLLHERATEAKELGLVDEVVESLKVQNA